MATVTLSGGTWAPGFAAGDLNSLAAGSQKTSSLASPQVDNTFGSLNIELEVTLGAISPAAGANVIVVLIPETQTAGTYATSADGATAATQARWQNFPYAIVALTQGAGAAQVQPCMPIPVKNGRYRIALINRAGVALAASGNQVAWRLTSELVS